MLAYLSRKLQSYKTVIQNTGYLLIIEIIRLALPFVALPYVIRTIGAEKYGTIVFTQTIIQYFIILINFGLDISAVKEVSVNRDNKKLLNEIISSVLIIKTMLWVVSLLILLVGIIAIPFWRDNALLFFLVFLTCLSELLFPVWFFQGIEKMKYLPIVRTCSILFYTITVFIFVKSSADYVWVAFLQSIGSLLSGIIAFFLLLRIERVKLLFPKIRMIRRLFVESIPFFISRVSNVLNLNMAKTVSGIFFTMDAVAAFDLAQRIAQVSLVPAQMLNQAVYPHIAKTQNRKFANNFLYCNITIAFSVALIVYFLAPFAVYYFAGNTMSEAITLLRILTLFIFCGCITTYLGTPVLVSFGYPKPFNMSVVLSTIILLFLYIIIYTFHLFSIEYFALTLFVTELAILFYRLYYCFHYKIFKL